MTATQLEPTADGSLTLYSQRYQQSYASSKGAYHESLHVFLQGTGVAERLAQHKAAKILEVGLGTGLNFLVTAQHALEHQASVDYHALEHTLLPAETLASLNYQAYASLELWQAWLTWRASLAAQPAPGKYIFTFHTIQLSVYLGEALQQQLGTGFQAVYMDAFSPEVNAELWHDDFLQGLYDCLEPTGVLGTYCVKGTVRRALTGLGFRVQKYAGPVGGKREVLKAIKPQERKEVVSG